MRILFLGAVRFSRTCLEAVAAAGGNVVAVMSPDAPAAEAADRESLAPAAARLGFPFRPFRRVGDPETVSFIRGLAPDVIFVFGLSQLLPEELLRLPPKGCIGTHPALLPRHRGRHPLIWTLVEGLAEGGLTFFYLDGGVDTGDILWQRPFPVLPDDDAGTLYGKIEALAREAIPAFLPALAAGAAPRRPQGPSPTDPWRRRTEEDGEIRWDGPASAAHNLVRALARPYPGAHTFWGERRLKAWRSRLKEGASAAPGEVLSSSRGELVVQANGGALGLLEWSLEGGGVPSAGDILGRRKP